MMCNLKIYLTLVRDRVNHALNKLLDDSPNPPRIKSAMRYSLMAGGKRIRPILCIAASEAVNGSDIAVMPAACALEMIHTYSLIHDDLPAMDNDRVRRGIPTCHIAFDEATAILAGDALLTLAFEVLSTEPQDKNDSIKALRVIRLIADAAGYKGMIEGQMRDIMFEGIRLEPDAIQELHQLKTGRLIQAALCSGAILGGGTEEQIEKLSSYGMYIGLAFQIADDILNVEGHPDKLGKATGTDAARKKNTYPAVIGMEQSKRLGNEMVQKAIQSIEIFDNKADPLRAIATYIMERNR